LRFDGENVTVIGVMPEASDARSLLGFEDICFPVAMSGTTPAWLAVSADVNDKLKESSRGATTSRSHHHLQHALIVGEVALALVLLSGAGATIRSLQRFVRLDPGWRVDGLLTAQLNLASYGDLKSALCFSKSLKGGWLRFPVCNRLAFHPLRRSGPMAAGNHPRIH